MGKFKAVRISWFLNCFSPLNLQAVRAAFTAPKIQKTLNLL